MFLSGSSWEGVFGEAVVEGKLARFFLHCGEQVSRVG